MRKHNSAYYSIAEQKSKLLTTITLNENSEDLSVKEILKRNLVENPFETDTEDENTIEGQSEDSFKLHISPYKKSSRDDYMRKTSSQMNKLEEWKHRINESRLTTETNLKDTQTRQLRVGSFKSLRDIDDSRSESDANRSLFVETTYLNKPREKLGMKPGERTPGEPKYQGKLSWVTDNFNLSPDMGKNRMYQPSK